MKNIKCPGCGLVNFASAAECKRCKRSLGHADIATPPLPEQVSQKPVLPERQDGKNSWRQIRPTVLLVIFGVPMFMALKNKMSGTAKPGGYVEKFDNWLLIIGGVGYLATFIYLILRER